MEQQYKQTTNLEQGLNLTPQLKRSLEILQKPNLELREFIDKELLTNPLLEEIRNDDCPPPQKEKPESSNGDFDPPVQEIYNSNAADSNNDNPLLEQKKHDYAINSLEDKISLEEYLLNEANLDAKNEEQAHAFAFLCGHLDDRGFLTSDALEKARAKGFDENSLTEALKLLRNSDPAGIGAFDMRDSLMLQLKRNKMSGSLAYKILENHYELLLKRKVSDIAKSENKSESDVENAISQISKLHTSPAREFAVKEEVYVTADILFFKDSNGEWKVELNDEYFPHLRINAEYRRMAADGALRKDEESYIKEKIRDAKFLMDALLQRQKTILKIGIVILQKQHDFFEKGMDALKSMTMQEVADIVEMHATTVGRAIAGKFAQTPFGIFPLRLFFSGGFESDEGVSVSSASVKEKIKELIQAESPSSPLSDSKLAELLQEDGVSIARRTVAKYREEMEIAPKNIRRRF